MAFHFVIEKVPHTPPARRRKYSNCGACAWDARKGQGLWQCLVGLRETMGAAGGLQRDLQSLSLASCYSKKVFLAYATLIFNPK